ncbi:MULTISPECIES: S1C family serine protease [unclassified Aerococcus]|uniref:S1C family serine protease n=1 Tax=unclassified Aerococcus TaxID=2618060 RepID=UPI0025B8AD2C|nr:MULTISPECIES: trypsin-like peptidase domain-containing protein [unclassified Aerococcus]
MSQSNDPNNLNDQSSVDNQNDEPIKNPNEPHRPEKKERKLTALQSGLIGGAVAAVLISGVGYAVTTANDPDDQISTEEVQSIVDEAVSSAQADNTASSVQSTSLDVTTDVSETVANVQDSVVSVVNMTESVSTYDLFGFTSPTQDESTTASSELETSSEGSGVVYKVDGDTAYVVTNNHVIDGADAINIIMADGTQVEAEVVGSDPWTDLAVLKISSDIVTTVAEFGDSDSLKVGEPAIAIGSPLGSEYATTVTQGIISGLDRSVAVDTDGDGTSDWVANVIQTDAAINPGNSGGALLNAAGQVIGINSMKVSSDEVEGMGFAIPSAEVQTIIAQLEENGEIVRPELGVSMVDLNRVSLDYQSQNLQLPDDVDGGVYIAEVVAGSAAEAAGLQADDVVVEFAGEAVTDSASLRQVLYQQESDASVEVSFYRNGELQTTTVQLQPQNSSTVS